MSGAAAWSHGWRLARAKPLGTAGAALVLLMLLMALAAPFLAPYDPNAMSMGERLAGPSGRHLLGTDSFGRDVFSRILYGAQVSLYVGVLATTLGTICGAFWGLVSAYLGGLADDLIQRLMDILLALPQLVLAIALVAALGASVNNVVIALAIVLMPSGNRVVRSAALAEKERQYVEAARCIGCGHGRILLVHLLPNVTAPIIVLASVVLGIAILTEASLSFLGLGPPPPAATWGSMLALEGQKYFEEAPGLALFPGVAISLAVLGINFLGDALRDLWDPRLRGRGMGG